MTEINDMSDSVPGPLISTGVQGLDHILKGGIPRHAVVLIQGAAGAGKTT
ncbi:MAG: hypothetical protein CMM50_14295, partial [Rhodospirillaceae bacterium]|nr:hypothetical protein [Rhodospirillaceae bacterium]